MWKRNKITLLWSAVVIFIVGGGFWWINHTAVEPGKYDEFAQCLRDKGAKFYGAFWCPHCQNQKAAFGTSAHLLPYIECSTPDERSQLPICRENNVKGYPTWVFADGSREQGEVSLSVLAQKTGCALPK